DCICVEAYLERPRADAATVSSSSRDQQPQLCKLTVCKRRTKRVNRDATSQDWRLKEGRPNLDQNTSNSINHRPNSVVKFNIPSPFGLLAVLILSVVSASARPSLAVG
ncbi:hypothetical protein H113_05466, partial [Trichophyton rubrum MR1459]